MLTLYFSGTGNTKYLASLFSDNMHGQCVSIEADVDFAALIASSSTIAFCYPIYGSRMPRNMRKFVHEHVTALKGKRLIIFVTQWLFSGDGARVLLDLLPSNHVEVIYAEYFNMPNNISNSFWFPAVSERRP